MGSAQKNPRPCILSNSRFEFILNVIHSLLSFPSFLHISDSCESLSLSNVNLLWGVFSTKALSCCSGDAFAISQWGWWTIVWWEAGVCAGEGEDGVGAGEPDGSGEDAGALMSIEVGMWALNEGRISDGIDCTLHLGWRRHSWHLQECGAQPGNHGYLSMSRYHPNGGSPGKTSITVVATTVRVANGILSRGHRGLDISSSQVVGAREVYTGTEACTMPINSKRAVNLY